jgi:hypothetical protein
MRIDRFVAAWSKYQPLDVTRWNIFFGRPGVDNERLNHMIREVSLPGKTLSGTDFEPYGPGRHIALQQRYEDELTMTFLVGKDGYESDYFSAWMEQVISPRDNFVSYYKDYVVDLGVQQYDKKGVLRYAWKFYEVYPYTVSSTELTNEAEGSSFWLTTKVTFKYRNFNWSGVTPEQPDPSQGGGGGISLPDLGPLL